MWYFIEPPSCAASAARRARGPGWRWRSARRAAPSPARASFDNRGSAMLPTRFLAALGLTILTLSASAATVLDNLAARPSGKILFNSVTTKSRYELANASYDPKPVVIWGTLGLPEGGHAPYPAMVLAHGSGGIEQKDWERWVPLLNKLGV